MGNDFVKDKAPKLGLFLALVAGLLFGFLPTRFTNLALAGFALMALVFLSPFFGLLLVLAAFAVDNVVLLNLGVAITPVKALAALALVSFILHFFSGRTRLVVSRQVPLIVAFISLASVSLIFASPFPEKGLVPIVRLFFMLALFLLISSLVNSVKRLKLVMLTIVLSSAVVSVLSLVFFGFFENGRFIGADADPNYLIILLFPALIFGIYLALMQKRFSQKLVYAVPIAPIFLSMILTFSRGGMIAVGLSFVMVASLQLRKIRSLLPLLLIIAMLVPFIPSELGERVSSLEELPLVLEGSYEDTSLYYRFGLFLSGLNMFFHNPLAGVGIANFRYHVTDYNMLGFSTKAQVAHNTYVSILAEMGIFAFLVFAAIILVTLNQLMAIRKFVNGQGHEARHIFRALLVSFFGLLLLAFFLDAQFEKQIWLVIALVAAFWGALRSESARAAMVE